MFQRQCGSRISAGVPLSPYYRFISSVVRQIYYPNCAVVGQPLADHHRPTLILCSHRNSAFDGYLAAKAFPRAVALVSVQLLNNPLLRVYFSGIPVLRKKDRPRFGGQPGSFDSPLEAGIAHIQAGGSLLLFPEGSSEWGHQPLPYQRGAARMIRSLMAQHSDFQVIPVGLFYVLPDKFGSHAEIYLGKAVEITAQGELSERQWEKQIHQHISEALNAVSVNCPDSASFVAAERYAYLSLLQGESYATAFLRYQQSLTPSLCATPSLAGEKQPDLLSAGRPETISITLSAKVPLSIKLIRWLGLGLMFIFIPVFLLSWFAARYADGRNTVSFFKILAGGLCCCIWLPVLLLLASMFPGLILLSLVCAALGYAFISYKGTLIC